MAPHLGNTSLPVPHDASETRTLCLGGSPRERTALARMSRTRLVSPLKVHPDCEPELSCQVERVHPRVIGVGVLDREIEITSVVIPAVLLAALDDARPGRRTQRLERVQAG